MKVLIKAGSTNQTLDLFVLDSTATDGSGLAAVSASSTVNCYYTINPTGPATALALVTNSATGAHTDGGWSEIDATNMPGSYRLGLSDAIVANTGSAHLMVKGATNMAQLPVELQMVDFDPNDGVRLGLTSLPNAAADAAGGLVISDTGGVDADLQYAGIVTNAQGADVATDVAAMIDGNNRVDVGSWLGSAVTLSTGNKPDVNVNEVSDDATAADNLESACDNYSVTRGLSGTALPAAAADAAGGLPISDDGGLDMDSIAQGIILGTCGATDLTTTTCSSDLSGYGNDQMIGRVIIFLAGPADGEATDITDYASSNGVLTFTALTLAPENGNAFKIV